MGASVAARVEALVPALLALTSAFAVITLGLWCTGASALNIFSALLTGAAGDQYRLTETLVKACPLLYTGLAVTLALHAGVWNIGAEGQLLLGALATAWAGRYTAPLSPALGVPVVCGAAMLAGSLWASCAALLKSNRGVNEVISTIMLNFIAAGLVSYCVHGPLMEAAAQYPQTEILPAAARLPRLLPPTRLHLGVPLALLVATGVWFLLFRTKAGFKLRATGANPRAARFAGFWVERQIGLALLLSGALAGLAGGIEVSGVTQRVHGHCGGLGWPALSRWRGPGRAVLRCPRSGVRYGATGHWCVVGARGGHPSHDSILPGRLQYGNSAENLSLEKQRSHVNSRLHTPQSAFRTRYPWTSSLPYWPVAAPSSIPPL